MDIVDISGKQAKINIFPKQDAFLRSDCDEVLYGGAAGGGKSIAMLLFGLKRRLEFPNTAGILLRRTYPELERSIIRESHKIYPHFGATYKSAKHLWEFENGSVQEFGHCFDDKTEILTTSGWRLFADLSRSECVASVNDKNEIVFVRPQKYIKYQYSGEMMSIQQRNGVDICCTPEHRFFVQKLNSGGKKKRIWTDGLFEMAKDFNGRRRIQRSFSRGPCLNKSEYVYFNSVKGGHKNITKCKVEDFSKFLGWFISEGCTSRYKYDVFIYQKNNLDKLKEDVRKCNFGFFVSYPKDNIGVPRVTISSKELHSWILDNCGGLAYEKRIPRECFDWSDECLKNMLDGLLLGDGHHDKRKKDTFRYSYTTTSKLLADDIQELCLRIGIRATIGEKSDGCRMFRGKEYHCRKQYCVSIGVGEYTEFRKTDVKKTKYSGMVYCVEARPYGKIVVRRNGRAYLAGNCERDMDVYRYHSSQYHDIGFDEASMFNEFQLTYMASRCRSSDPAVKPLIRLASNPGNVGHGYLFKRFIEPWTVHKKWNDPVVPSRTMTFIPAKIKDNPALAEADPTYIQRLKSLPEKKYLALAEGRWDVFEGSFFTEWDSTLGQSVLANPHIPERTTHKIMSLDWGFAEPACVLWYEITPMGRVFVYRELYVTRFGPKRLAKEILDLTPDDELKSMDYFVAPPEIWGKTADMEGGGETIQQLMESVFGDNLPMIKANNSRVPGWMKVREYMTKAPDGYPWLQISPTCHNLIRTIPSIIHDDIRPEDTDKACEDHACLTGETIVETPTGGVPLNSVQVGDLVITREGSRRVIASAMTNASAEIRKVVLSNGAILTGTGDHPVFVANKKDFLPIDSLRYGDILSIWDNKQSHTTGFGFVGIQKAFGGNVGCIIRQVGCFVRWVLGDFIRRYGRPIMELYRRIPIFTTLTGTHSTIIFPTSNASLPVNIYPSIPLGNAVNYNIETSREFGHSHLHGTKTHETKKFMSEAGNSHGKKELLVATGMLFAKCAIWVLEHTKSRMSNFVPMLVRRSGEEKSERTTSRLIVLFVQKHSNRIVMIIKKLAQGFVGNVYVLNVEKTNKRLPVYNLTVEKNHEYFANGILVSNCDTLRYGVVGLGDIPKKMVTPYESGYEKIFGKKESGNRLYSDIPLPGSRGGY